MSSKKSSTASSRGGDGITKQTTNTQAVTVASSAPATTSTSSSIEAVTTATATVTTATATVITATATVITATATVTCSAMGTTSSSSSMEDKNELLGSGTTGTGSTNTGTSKSSVPTSTTIAGTFVINQTTTSGDTGDTSSSSSSSTTLKLSDSTAVGTNTKCTRITRQSSPMLMHSPSTSSNKKLSDEAEAGGEGEHHNKSSSNTEKLMSTDESNQIKPLPIASSTTTAGSSTTVPTTTTTTTTASNIRGRKSLKDIKDALKLVEIKFVEHPKDASSSSNTGDGGATIITLTTQKDLSKDKPLPTTTTDDSRVTRKTRAERCVITTRITRNRRQSVAVSSIVPQKLVPPTTTPTGSTRGRKKKIVATNNTPTATTTTITMKRKRSVEDLNASFSNNNDGSAGGRVKARAVSDEPGSKYLKLLEEKEAASSVEDSKVFIKEELLSDDNEEPLDTPPMVAVSAPATSSSLPNQLSKPTSNNNQRGSGARQQSTRNKQRSLSPAAASSSQTTTTRATRQTKTDSPAITLTIVNTRRRMGSNSTRSSTSTSSSNNNKIEKRAAALSSASSMAAPINDGNDADVGRESPISSTGSLAAAGDTALVLQIITEMEGEMARPFIKEEKKENVDDDLKALESTESTTKMVQEPLKVDINVTTSASADNLHGESSFKSETPSPKATLSPAEVGRDGDEPLMVPADADKAASLSPAEMVSEGVNVISVKQFYKKTEFLENNLGIEEDPKLGELVQKQKAAASSAIVNKNEDPETVLQSTKEDLSITDADIEIDMDMVGDGKHQQLLVFSPESSAGNEVNEEKEVTLKEVVSDNINDNNDDTLLKNNAATVGTLVVLPNSLPLSLNAVNVCNDGDQISIDCGNNDDDAIDEKSKQDADESVEYNTSFGSHISESYSPCYEGETMSQVNLSFDPDDVPGQEDYDAFEKEIEELGAVDAKDIPSTGIITIMKKKTKEHAATSENILDEITSSSNEINHSSDGMATFKVGIGIAGEEELEEEESLVTQDNQTNSLFPPEAPEAVIADADEDTVNKLIIDMDTDTDNTNEENKENVASSTAASNAATTTKEDDDDNEIHLDTSTNTTEELKDDDEEEEQDDDVKKKVLTHEENFGECTKTGASKVHVDADLMKMKIELMKEDHQQCQDQDDLQNNININNNNDTTTKMDLVVDNDSDIKIDEEDATKQKLLALGTLIINSSSENDNDYNVEDAQEDQIEPLIVSPLSSPNTSFHLTNEEQRIRQELHLQNLGLLTHKAADLVRQEDANVRAAAAIVKQQPPPPPPPIAATTSKRNSNKGGGGGAGPSSTAAAYHASSYADSSGTLKTVIKLNRFANGGNTCTGSVLTNTTAAASGGNATNTTCSVGGSSGTGRKTMTQGGSNSGSGSSSTTQSGNGVRRQSLKMTFQKGRGRNHQSNADRSNDPRHSGGHIEDAYYTIQNENEGRTTIQQQTSNGTTNNNSNNNNNNNTINNNNNNGPITKHGRKSYNNRYNTINKNETKQNNSINSNNGNNKSSINRRESSHSAEGGSQQHQDASQNYPHGGSSGSSLLQPAVAHHHLSKKDDREEILIPEKASSFKFHPGRLCNDQCHYCSGKFGLYDTPCHVGQIKSLERQQKILEIEKLTVDNCLCDACFRHVDRRAIAVHKKRLPAIQSGDSNNGQQEDDDNVPSCSSKNTSAVNAAAIAAAAVSSADGTLPTPAPANQKKCVITDCPDPAAHSLRRKCIRKSVKKFLLNFTIPAGTNSVWLCHAHYEAVIQCSGCVLCKRRLGKNHMYHITSDTARLEKALSDMGIPVQLGIGTAVCKLCRYFANLLMKPLDTSTKSQKTEFVQNYRKRLLKFHNIHEEEEEESSVLAVTATATEKSLPNSCTTGQPKSSLSSAPTFVTINNNTTNEDDGNTDEREEELNFNNIVMNRAAETSLVVPHLAATAIGNILPSPTPSKKIKLTSDDGTSSSSSLNKQMSKLKAILQQNHETMTVNLNNSNNSSDTMEPLRMSSGTDSSSSSNKDNNHTLSPLAAAAAATTTTTAAAAAADISNVLRANPNISMRELFHGEEELGFQFKAPFGCSTSQRTPEGWTRVQTFLQYDEPTRQLWEKLQKPYGNQSSFLKHLILLEKHYRNGDLILAPNASPNASLYSQTVLQRLKSYDEPIGGRPSTSSASTSNLLNNNHQTGAVAGARPFQRLSSTEQQTYYESLVTESMLSGGTGGDNPASTSIPTVELNDDDGDEVEEVVETNVPGSNNNNDCTSGDRLKQFGGQLRDEDVIVVDKLQKQLSSNAVTIIARPKDNSSATGIAVTPSASAIGGGIMKSRRSAPEVVESLKSTSSSGGSATTTPATCTNSRSILKTNLLGLGKAVEIVPLRSNETASNKLPTTPTTTPAQTSSGSGGGENKQQKILTLANKLLVNQIAMAHQQNQQQQQQHHLTNQKLVADVTSSSSSSGSLSQAAAAQQAKPKQMKSLAGPTPAQLLSSPPELISFHRRRPSGANTAAAAGTAVSMAIAGAAPQSSGNNLHRRLQLPKIATTARNAAAPSGSPSTASSGSSSASSSGGSSAAGGAVPPNVVILPGTLTREERQESRSWRPTLLSNNEQVQNTHILAKSGKLYQTADGRRLPGLVQVQSGGNPYLISIFDYNRMCILRREKIFRERMLKDANKRKQIQQQPNVGNQHHAVPASINSNSRQQQQLQQGRENGNDGGATTSNMQATNKIVFGRQTQQKLPQQQQQQHQQQHLVQLRSAPNQQQIAGTTSIAVVPNSTGGIDANYGSVSTVGGGGAAAGNGNVRYQRLAPKPATTIPPLGAITPSSTTLSTAGYNLPYSTHYKLGGNANKNAGNNTTDATGSACSAGTTTSPWLWTNFQDANQFLLNGNVAVGNNKLSHLIITQQPPTGAGGGSSTSTSSSSVTAATTSGGAGLRLNSKTSTVSKQQQQQNLHQQQQQQHLHHQQLQQQQQQQHKYLENAMMRIPKSLTVIPQHKLRGSGGGGGNNAIGGGGGGGNNTNGGLGGAGGGGNHQHQQKE